MGQQQVRPGVSLISDQELLPRLGKSPGEQAGARIWERAEENDLKPFMTLSNLCASLRSVFLFAKMEFGLNLPLP